MNGPEQDDVDELPPQGDGSNKALATAEPPKTDDSVAADRASDEAAPRAGGDGGGNANDGDDASDGDDGDGGDDDDRPSGGDGDDSGNPPLDEVDVRDLLRRALDKPAEQRAPKSVLADVQRRLREESKGRYFADGWSTSPSPRETYIVTSLLMLLIIVIAWVLLGPIGVHNL